MSKAKARRPLVSAALEAAGTSSVITSSRDSVMGRRAPDAVPATSVRHGYRATLYLPREAQYKIREIALMKRCKPHDVLLEAMADLFERYNAGELADRLRKPSRDDVTT